jgi:hypothetical protein
MQSKGKAAQSSAKQRRGEAPRGEAKAVNSQVPSSKGEAWRRTAQQRQSPRIAKQRGYATAWQTMNKEGNKNEKNTNGH